MSSASIQAVRGMNDILPDQSAHWEYFEQVVREWLAGYGYRQIRTPVVEKTELFVRSIGEVTDIVEKEMYTFVDALNGDSLTLRPEGTASCLRAALQHNLLYSGPQRLYYQGPMFRHERPQKGRYRQFHQVGVEALGLSGPDIDAEHILMCARLWRMLGLDDLRLEINTLGNPEARARHRARLIEYFKRYEGDLDEDARRRLHTNPLRILDSKNPAMRYLLTGAPRLADDLDDEAVRHFAGLQALIGDAGVPFIVNPRLVRGLDYYNLTVSEWVTTRLGAQATVCAGGRYDGLIAQLGGKSQPACGFALGVERLVLLLGENGHRTGETEADVYLVHAGDAADRWAWQVAEQLRDAGLYVVVHCGGGNFKSQMKRADSSGARFAVIIGDNEAAAGEVALKSLRELTPQSHVRISDVATLVRAKG